MFMINRSMAQMDKAPRNIHDLLTQVGLTLLVKLTCFCLFSCKNASVIDLEILNEYLPFLFVAFTLK